MGQFRPAVFPRRPKHSNIFSEAKYQIQLSYIRYECHTGLYVMTPGEKTAFNTIVLSVLLMLFFAAYFYLPRTTLTGLRRMAYYFTGQHKLHMNTMDLTQGVMKGSGDAVASLMDNGSPVNASMSAFAP